MAGEGECDENVVMLQCEGTVVVLQGVWGEVGLGRQIVLHEGTVVSEGKAGVVPCEGTD